MIIELTGASTRNKGAELMALAVRGHLAEADPAIQLAVDPWFGPYPDRARYGLLTKLCPTRVGRSSLAVWLMPRSFRASYGLVAESDIDTVLDAAGFAFSDQFGPGRVEGFAADVIRWKRQGKKVVMLPQALGPFKDARVRAAFRSILEQVDLVFARDSQSMEYAADVGGAADRLALAPDFTNLVQAVCPGDFEPSDKQVCLVPNDRMIEKGGPASGAYLPFMAECARQVRSRGFDPVLLLHDPKSDGPLVAPLLQAIGLDLPVVRHLDPRHLKWILGRSLLVIGSRFHALVSALSQAVPCLASGWSHKYQALFADYGCGQCVVQPTDPTDRLAAALDRLLDAAEHDRMTQSLRRHGDQIKASVQAMWRRVDSVLGLSKADTKA
jgi:colanic acid/amylovoran biosynthesis protein